MTFFIMQAWFKQPLCFKTSKRGTKDSKIRLMRKNMQFDDWKCPSSKLLTQDYKYEYTNNNNCSDSFLLKLSYPCLSHPHYSNNLLTYLTLIIPILPIPTGQIYNTHWANLDIFNIIDNLLCISKMVHYLVSIITHQNCCFGWVVEFDLFRIC